MLWLTENEDESTVDTVSFFDWTLVLGLEVNEHIGVFVETFGLVGINGTDETISSFDGGLTYLLTPRLQLDGSIALGLSSLAPDWAVGLGVTYRFPRFKGTAQRPTASALQE